jgi:hypothetical protein
MRHAVSIPPLILGLTAAAAAQLAVLAPVPEPKIPFNPERYVVYRAAGPIEVDGQLTEGSWQAADWTRGFRDIQGPSQPEPRHRTVVQMLWDDDYLYVGAFLQEPHLSATLTQRDAIIFNDNDFEVFIDPDGDTHDYFELEMNALNTVWDLLLVRPYRDGGPAVHGWDIRGLKTAVGLKGSLNDPSDEDKAWTVEIALPFAALRECIAGMPPRPEAGDQWRMTFSRVEWRYRVENGAYIKVKDASSGRPLPEDNWTWTPQGPINIHYPEMWGFVQFSGKAAGRGKDKFVERPEEKVKWALRKIYYRERGRAADGQKFSADLGALGLVNDKQLRVKGWNFPPRIQVTDSLFEAVYENAAGENWRIRQDGLVWKTAPVKK